MAQPIWPTAKQLYNMSGPVKKWGTRLGRMYEINAHPCGATPEIWVKAFFTALPTLLLTPIKPSAVDYMIIRIGLGHGTKRRKFFDVWDFEQLPQVKKAGVQWVVFKLAGLGARALWYIAIADGITGFGVNWESAIYQYSGCLYPGEAYAQMDQQGPSILMGPTVGTQFLTWWEQGSNIFSCGGPWINTPAGYDPSVSFSLSTTKNPNPLNLPEPGYEAPSLSLVDFESGKTIDTADTMTDNVTGSTHTLHVNSDGLGTAAKQYGVTWSMGGGWALITSGTFSAFGRPSKDNIKPDP